MSCGETPTRSLPSHFSFSFIMHRCVTIAVPMSLDIESHRDGTMRVERRRLRLRARIPNARNAKGHRPPSPTLQVASLAHSSTHMTHRRSNTLSTQSAIAHFAPRVMRGPATGRGRNLALHIAAAQVSSNDFKTGMSIEMDGQPYKVVEFLHVKPGKGAAFVRSKIKNLLSGNSVEKTWRAGETVELAQVETKEAQFTYLEGSDYVFMDMTSYEEVRIEEDSEWSKYLKEGMVVQVMEWNGKVISVDLPNTVELEVVETDPGVKGNTAQGGSKPATLETGAVVQVPLFIQLGEKIKVDTRSHEYLSRAS